MTVATFYDAKSIEIAINLDQAAVTMNPALIQALQDAIRSLNFPTHLLPSGAGHDAAVMAQAAGLADELAASALRNEA